MSEPAAASNDASSTAPNNASAIALYLGESYASLGSFDLGAKTSSKSKSSKKALSFEKSVFLPQVSLKNLLNQAKTALEQKPVQKVFVVTRYLDRLKNFRLGGSVAQVVHEGFENSYAAVDTRCLSLAAATLVISVSDAKVNEEFLTSELARIKKINPDANKIVLQLPEEKISAKNRELIHEFFTKAGFKIFACPQPNDLSQVRRTLLNAGSEGTKEEILSEIKDAFGDAEVYFWTSNQFKKEYENCELFSSASDFLATCLNEKKLSVGAYMDHESFRIVSTEKKTNWESPWGLIPIHHSDLKDLNPHPFSEIKLDHLSMLTISTKPTPYEPGPVLAGRGMKPLVIDAFQSDLNDNLYMQSIFPNMNSELQKKKIDNHFSVLEKGQIKNSFSTNKDELKSLVLSQLLGEIHLSSTKESFGLIGPLQHLVQSDSKKIQFERTVDFSWPLEIMKRI